MRHWGRSNPMSNVVWISSESGWRSRMYSKGGANMADVDFEARLLRLYDEPPALADAQLFAHRVEARLDRGWGIRQVLIGAFGFVGGLIGAMQMVGSGVGAQLREASSASTAAFSRELDQAMRSGFGLDGLPLNGEVMWMAAALGVMALALAVTRAVEEF